jgi:hypothetical protein
MKQIRRLIITLVLALTLVACSVVGSVTTSDTSSAISSNTTSSSTTTSQAISVATAATSVDEALAENSETHENAEDYVWDSSTETAIVLNGDSITISGDGVSVDGSKATITSPGTYNISGTLSDGQIVVNTEEKQVVRLILNGVDINSSTSAPIDIINAEETIIILADNTENFVSDGASYVFDDPTAEEPSAAIFSNGDLSFSGNGSLTVNGNFNDGVSSDDGVIIAGGTLMVNAVDDGIRGKDYLVVENGNITVNAGGDGLKSDNEEDAASGYILVENGVLNVTAGGDAINAQTDVMIKEGIFTISAGGGSSYRADEATSAKGIKGTANVNIDGGTFEIDASDDALHSNGNITINDGTFTLATADDGMHADSTLVVNGGNIQITNSYEGIESAVITLNGGNIHIVASDDGINVAGGGDGSGFNADFAQGGRQPGGPGSRPDFGGGPGQDAFAAFGDYHLYINGGYVAIEASGDGIDANGTIEMTDGVVLVNGPTEQMNGALDHAGFTMTGGYLVAAGSSGMAMAPSQTSSQYSVLIYFESTQPAGTLVHIQNSAGEEILTFAPSKEYQSLAFSSADLVDGETYTIYVGGSSTGTATDSLVQDGTYTPGVQYTSFTVSGMVTTVGSGGGGFQRQRP